MESPSRARAVAVDSVIRTFEIAIIVWILVSFPVAVLIGRFIKVGRGPIVAILALLCVAMVPPMPIVKRAHQSAAVHQGRAAMDQISKPNLIVLPAPTTNVFVWRYPPGVVAENWFWNIEASKDLRNWSVLISNASGPGEVRVKRTDPPGFYRLSGRPSP
jgi:hypothetical protein